MENRKQHPVYSRRLARCGVVEKGEMTGQCRWWTQTLKSLATVFSDAWKKVIYHDKAIFILGMQNWFNIRNSILIHYIWNRLKRKTVPPFQRMQKKQLIKLTYIHEKGRKFSKQWGIEKSFVNQMIKGITKNLKQWSGNYTHYRSSPAHHLFLLLMVYWNKAISIHLSTVRSSGATVATETVWPWKPKIFTIWLLTGKVTNSDL